MEVVDLLDVAKDDVLFIEDARGYLLHTTGHFPQVGLQDSKKSSLEVCHGRPTKKRPLSRVGQEWGRDCRWSSQGKVFNKWNRKRENLPVTSLRTSAWAGTSLAIY